MPEARAHVEDVTERTRLRVSEGALSARIEGELARHAHEGVRGINGAHDALGRGQVDAEGLLAEEVSPRRRGSGVDLLVQLMRHSDVEDIDRVIVDQVAPVVRQSRHRVDAREPLARSGRRIGDGHDPRPHRMIDEQIPSSAHSGEFAAHEATADDADPDIARLGHDACRISRARWALAPSCSMAMSARVIPAGLPCWMMLRP